MIDLSVVICSRNKSLRKNFLTNLDHSIGCKYELISIDNSYNRYSIFEAYNIGIDRSNAATICFIHEDILFHTENWGLKIIDIFNEFPNAGLIGVAGSRKKSLIPTGWWEHNKSHLVKNVMQHRPDGTMEVLNTGFSTGNEQEVVVVDGVFMCLRKGSQTKFNENLKGFHNYDQSISLDCLKNGFKVFVTNRVLLEHFSNGSIDSGWVISTHEFHRLYKADLPKIIGRGKISKGDKSIDLTRFIFHCKNTGNVKLAFHYWLKLLQLQPLSSDHLKHLLYFIKFFKSKII